MLEVEDRTAAGFGLEERHPFLDRRIAEFALAIPEEQRWRGRYPKYVLRQAMKGLLPERIRTRTTKADFSHVFADVLTSFGGRGFFNHLAIEAMQWVDGGRIRLMYDELARLYARHDNRYITWTWPLWSVVGLECWFRATFLADRSCERLDAPLALTSGA
jgi:asparagine synthase (glutamine-hydrolysing)